MASEDHLKKAVAAFNALSPEQQAEMMEEQRKSWVRGNIGLSRDERGMTSPVMPRPAPADLKAGDRKHYKLIRKSLQNKGLLPAATDTVSKDGTDGLETVHTQVRFGPNDVWRNEVFVGERSRITERRELVTRSQAESEIRKVRKDAEELLAEVTKERDHWYDISRIGSEII